MNRLLIILFLLVSGLVVNAENVSNLIPPPKPMLSIEKAGKKTPHLPVINPQQKLAKQFSKESYEYECKVYTDSSDAIIVGAVKEIGWYPAKSKNIEIIYEVKLNCFNKFSYKRTISNASLDEINLTDKLMKHVIVDLKKYKLPKSSQFKIYFVQKNILRNNNSSTEPIVSYKNKPIMSSSAYFLPHPILSFNRSEAELKTTYNDKSLEYFYIPSVKSKIQNYDSNIDMNFVPPSIHVENIDGYCDYCYSLENKLYANWTPLNDNISRNVVFVVSSFGFYDRLNYKLISSSDDPSADKSAILALYNTVVDYPLDNYRVTFHSGAPDIPNFDAYLAQVSLALKRNWKPYDKGHSLPIEVEICVSDTGEIFSWHIVKSSKNQKQDDAVINSILLVNSLPQFPKYYRGNYVKLRVTYNVDKISEMTSDDIASMPDYLKLYYKKIFSIISRNIEIKKIYGIASPSLETKFFVRIDRTGQVLDAQIVKSSGNKIFDDLVLKAISSSFFPPLPKEYNGDFIDVVSISRVAKNL